MDVAVCGAQKLFMRGGAELLQENLVRELAAAGHRAEAVRLPVAWEKDRLFDSPLAWRMLPMDADAVIALNFPSYFVRHPNKAVWLLHQHRGAYDLADDPQSDVGLDDQSLAVQSQLAAWDDEALGEAKHIYTLSGVVTDRLRRFNGIDSEPLPHPPPLADRLHPGPAEDFLFLPTRLEENKRPELMIEALRDNPGVRGVLAGRGSREAALRAEAERAGVADRLTFAGFVSDSQLVDLFARCLGVLYAPQDEDYGYVTLQAFLAGKPVVTAKDSGGVLDWVTDGETGYVTDGSRAGIGEAVGRLAAHRETARAMGEAGRERAAKLAWGPVVEALLTAATR